MTRITFRQFKALTKKNFIEWTRQPGSAACELICPGLLMLILVWVRVIIKSKNYQIDNLESEKLPFFPALEYLGDGSWTSDFITTSSR